VVHKYSVFGFIKTFIIGVSVSMIFQFVIAGLNYNATGNVDVFYYNLFSYFHHPAYFSMYTNFAIASLLVLIFHYRERIQWRHFLLLGFLVVGVYQLSSRNGLITLSLLILYAFLYIIFPKLKWKKMLLSLFLTILISASIVYPLAKYTNTIRTVNISSSKSSSGVRIAMWKASVPIVLDNFFFGVGTGDVNRVLQQEFAEQRIVRAVRDNLNAHNQFLQTQVSLGLMGTLALILGLGFPFLISVKKGKLFFPLFVGILVLNFLTESVFNTQAGVIYFTVLNSVLFFTYED
jgi:O-antigen ligase